MAQEFITTEQARKELGDDGYFALSRWLREKGYFNLTQTGEGSYKNEIFVTRDQLFEFIREVNQSLKGSLPINQLWGQTREHLRGYRKGRKKIK